MSKVKPMNIRQTLPARLKMAGYHLALSTTIFVITFVFLRYVCFPAVHFWINGGWQGMRIMFFIDIVLGPLLTFLIFNPHKPKKEKISDLSIIAAVQLCALIYGFHTILQQRPLFLLLHHGATIETVTPENYNGDNIRQIKWENFPKLTHLPLVSFNPEKRAENSGLDAPSFVFENLVKGQKFIRKYLDKAQEEKFAALEKQSGEPLYLLKIVGSYQSNWVVVDKDFRQIDDLGVSPNMAIPGVNQ